MSRFEILAPKELPAMRKSCVLAAQTLEMIGPYIQPGITTDAIDKLVHEFITSHAAYPSPLNYHGFPRSVCTSVNAVVCHGIPGPYTLKEGDIINVDVTTTLPAKNGYYGDTSATFYVGEPDPMAIHVVEVAREALEIGIAAAKPGGRFGDIGYAIQTFVESKGCSVVRDYTGHGIGRTFHTEPSVRHFGRRGDGPPIKPGMTFTIEPMVNLGSFETELQRDRWTVLTADRSLSAQFEHTMLVTQDGIEVLTDRSERLKHSEDRPYTKLGTYSGARLPPRTS